MQIVKKNIVSIIFGVIAILAVVAAFYPMGGQFDGLREKLEKRRTVFTSAKSILDKPRELPVIKLDDTSARTPLPIFPMPVVTKMAQGYMDQLVSQSRGVFEAAVRVNRHESRLDEKGALLLVEGALPEPRGNVENEFKRALQPDLNDNSIYSYLRTQVLGGGFPPTEADIKKEDERLQAKYNKELVKGADGNPINQDTVTAAYQAESALIPERLKNEVATQSRMYVDPEAIAAPKEIVGVATAPQAHMIWYAQAALWVQMDVCRAIAETNEESKNIPNAPVKRLLSLNVPFGPAMYVQGSATGTADTVVTPIAAPVAAMPRFTDRRRMPMGGGGGYTPPPRPEMTDVNVATAAPGTGGGADGDPQKVYQISPTGRTCNKIYDVIGFSMVVHVDQTKLPLLLVNLSKNRFITVKKVDLLRKDNAELLEAGFVYGPAPIAEVTLECEALQLREWTVPLMPQAVRSQLLGPGVEYTSLLKPADKTAE